MSSCVAVAPEPCDGFCDALLACFELPPEPDNVQGCQFECLLYGAYAALTDTPQCDAATDAFFDCFGSAECQDMALVGCDAEERAYVGACDIP